MAICLVVLAGWGALMRASSELACWPLGGRLATRPWPNPPMCSQRFDWLTS
jgi:hypothetical protein